MRERAASAADARTAPNKSKSRKANRRELSREFNNLFTRTVQAPPRRGARPSSPRKRISASQREGWTVELRSKAGAGDFQAVKRLVEYGADFDAKDDRGQTALHEACSEGHKTIARLLLDKGCAITQDDDGLTALHEAARGGHEAVARLLLKNGEGVVDLQNMEGETALQMATSRGHRSVARLLLDWNADLTKRNNLGWSALNLAAKKGDDHLVKLFVKNGADINEPDNYGQTALFAAVSEGHDVVVKYLLDAKADIEAMDNLGWTILHEVSAKGHESTARLLLNRKADVDLVDVYGTTALHEAASHGNEVVASDARRRVSIARIGMVPPTASSLASLLIRARANPDAKNNEGQTPLHCAVINGNEMAVNLFIDKGADLGIATTQGKTPLHLAALWGKDAVVRLVLDRGGTVNAVDGDERTPLHEAAKFGNLACGRILIQNGANVDGQTLNEGFTPLHEAAVEGNFDFIRMLMENFAIIDIKSRKGQTALDVSRDARVNDLLNDWWTQAVAKMTDHLRNPNVDMLPWAKKALALKAELLTDKEFSKLKAAARQGYHKVGSILNHAYILGLGHAIDGKADWRRLSRSPGLEPTKSQIDFLPAEISTAPSPASVLSFFTTVEDFQEHTQGYLQNSLIAAGMSFDVVHVASRVIAVYLFPDPSGYLARVLRAHLLDGRLNVKLKIGKSKTLRRAKAKAQRMAQRHKKSMGPQPLSIVSELASDTPPAPEIQRGPLASLQKGAKNLGIEMGDSMFELAIYDYVRCTVVCDSPDTVLRVQDRLTKGWPATVVAKHNRFAPSFFSAKRNHHRDITLLLAVPFPGFDCAFVPSSHNLTKFVALGNKKGEMSIICEIRIMLREWELGLRQTELNEKVIRAQSPMDLHSDCQAYRILFEREIENERTQPGLLFGGGFGGVVARPENTIGGFPAGLPVAIHPTDSFAAGMPPVHRRRSSRLANSTHRAGSTTGTPRGTPLVDRRDSLNRRKRRDTLPW